MMAESTAVLPVTSAEEGRTLLSVEHVLYAAIMVGALWVRFISLSAQPLAPFEAAQAWPAWLAAAFAQVAHAPQPQSALLYSLQSWLFMVAGGNDWLARLAPAMVGVALAGVPYYWRSWIGRVPALVVAALFAFDPWLVALSRAADGACLSLFLGLADADGPVAVASGSRQFASAALGTGVGRQRSTSDHERRTSLELCPCGHPFCLVLRLAIV